MIPPRTSGRAWLPGRALVAGQAHPGRTGPGARPVKSGHATSRIAFAHASVIYRQASYFKPSPEGGPDRPASRQPTGPARVSQRTGLRSAGLPGSNARLTDPDVSHAARHLALLMSAPGTQNGQIWTAREQIGIEPAPAPNGGSARGYQRDLRDVGRSAGRRSARHAAARPAYLCTTILREECSLMPPTGSSRIVA